MKNGKTYQNLYHFLFVVRDGKIQSVKEYLDTMHAADVLCS
jgi:ketosteroid isomerase-like protein